MLFITAGHNLFDSGAVEGALVEANLTKELRDLIASYLPKDSYWLDKDNWNVGQTANAVALLCNIRDLCLDLHFNDSDNPKASGCEMIVGDLPIDGTIAKAEKLLAITSAVLKIPNRGIKSESETPRGKLAMMRIPCQTMILEVSFLSNTGDMEHYQAHKEVLAEALANELKAIS